MGTCTAERGKPGSRAEQSTWFSFYAFLGSSRFGLFLLLAIGCVSFLGMFVIQNAPEEQYGLRYGGFWANFILHTGLDSIYRVWWYLLLILLATLNLVLCSLMRIKASFKQAFSSPKAEDHAILSNAIPLEVPSESRALASRLRRILTKKGFTVDSSEDGSLQLVAGQKGSISRIGFLVTHLGVILVLVAGVVNSRLGYSYQQTLSIGESFQVSDIEPSASFSIRVDDFVIETNKEGRIVDYKSRLTVVENGTEVLTKVIEVNDPLTYRGISFYQASYGQEPGKIREASILYVEEGLVRTMLKVPLGERREVPGTDMEIRVVDYVPDFVHDLATGIVTSRSLEPRRPAVKLEIIREGDVTDSGWLIIGMDIHSASRELAHFHFADYHPVFYTGLDVARNPGVPLLFAGFAAVGIGIFLSFFVFFRRVWIKVSEERPGHYVVRIAGSSSKHPLALKREIDDLYGLAKGEHDTIGARQK